MTIQSLIPLNPQQIDGETVDTVNARDLHSFLESKQQFTDWMKNRINEYGFAENIDYVCVSENYETQRTNGQIGTAASIIDFNLHQFGWLGRNHHEYHSTGSDNIMPEASQHDFVPKGLLDKFNADWERVTHEFFVFLGDSFSEVNFMQKKKPKLPTVMKLSNACAN